MKCGICILHPQRVTVRILVEITHGNPLTKFPERAASANDTSVFEKDPNMTTRPGKEKVIPPSLDSPVALCEDISTRALVKSRSQPKVAAKKGTCLI